MRKSLDALNPLSRALATALVTTGLLSAPAVAQQDFSKVEIKTVQLTERLYMLEGAGGNIGVSAGDDGVYLIDDQYAPLSEKILAAVRAISDGPIKLVVNTHWHGDHTGGNENMAGEGALIIAHENVRKRKAAGQEMPAFNSTVPPAPESALPKITYPDNAALYLNGEQARLQHLPYGHTDGDTFVYFPESNVMHTGDLFFNGFYPFIDAWSGGSITGVIAAADKMLDVANDETQIVPGHGPLADRAALVRYRDMLAEVLGLVRTGMGEGKSAKALVDSGVFKDIEASWGGGFLDTAKFIEIVYAGMKTG